MIYEKQTTKNFYRHSETGETNIDYVNELSDIEGDPEVLRDDPAFEKILRVYDLAKTYLAAACQD